ncbi:hypothetical protein [Streptomyces sp. NPDC000877]|uniref:hypothetical protein n=1 Tax=unclassified Streptomyces TaxID=2593676 RepID=UPI003333715B
MTELDPLHVPPRITEPLRWEEVDSPPRYAGTTDKPVQYAPVVDRSGVVLGYVWANDEDDAAGWQYRRAGGDEAFNMGALWATEFHEAKEQGLTPSAALAKMTRAYGPEDPSHIVPESVRQAPNLQALKELAAESTEKRGLMSSERPINPRFAEDMHFNFVSGPPRYRSHTDKPVRYVTVADKVSGAVLGYVWAGDEDDAAAWAPSQAAGARALADGGHWHARLQEAKERGLSPSAALSEMLSAPEGNRGRVLPDSLAVAPNAATVKALAAGDQPTVG